MSSNLFGDRSRAKYISSINSVDTLVFFYLNARKVFGLALFYGVLNDVSPSDFTQACHG